LCLLLINSVESRFLVHFLCLPKENEPKESAPWHLVLRTALRSSKLPGFCKLASLKQAKSFSAASAVLSKWQWD
jgi:hypothetical protein